MIPIPSSIEGFEATFGYLRDQFETEEFSLGGGYEYDHGYFDKALDANEDQGNRYYLRIPAYSMDGNLDEPETRIQLGRPFVIKHEFRTSNDPTGDIGLVSAVINQFSKPIPTEDSPIDEKWVIRAKEALKRIETKLISDWQGR